MAAGARLWRERNSERPAIHLTFDDAQAAASNAMELYVDGMEVERQSAGIAATSIDLDSGDELCLGNDLVPTTGAFGGVIWYAAIYDEVLSTTEVLDAALRLSFSDDEL
jgi:hypothetical protein